jgi:hypothetical protein
VPREDGKPEVTVLDEPHRLTTALRSTLEIVSTLDRRRPFGIIDATAVASCGAESIHDDDAVHMIYREESDGLEKSVSRKGGTLVVRWEGQKHEYSHHKMFGLLGCPAVVSRQLLDLLFETSRWHRNTVSFRRAVLIFGRVK